MNWGFVRSTFDEIVNTVAGHWLEGALVLALAAVCIGIAGAFPDAAAKWRVWSRILRYCIRCDHCDVPTRACNVGAADGEKCGLIDASAGMNFTISKDE